MCEEVRRPWAEKGFGRPLVAAAVLALGLALASQVQSASKEMEPNNSPEDATLIPLGTQAIRGSSDLMGDVDYYQTEFVAGTQTRVVLTDVRGDFIARMEFLDAAGNPIVIDFERNPDGTFKLDSNGQKIPIFAEVVKTGSELTLTLRGNTDAAFQPGSGFLPPGIGFIRISNDFSEPDKNMAFNYKLLLSRGDAEVEANDNVSQAQPITPGTAILGSYPLIGPAVTACSAPPSPGCSSDADCANGTCVPFEGTSDDVYTFSVSDPDLSAVVVLAIPESTSTDMAVELTDAGGTVLGSAVRQVFMVSGEIVQPFLAVPLKGSGQFFVRVFAPNLVNRLVGTEPLNYTLFLKIQGGEVEVEPNPSFVEAVEVQVGDGVTIHGGLQTEGDIDVYRVEVPPGQVLIADVDAVSPINLLDGVVSAFLRDDVGKAFASNNDSSLLPADASFSLVNRDGYLRVLPPQSGEVFVAVGDLNGDGGALGFDYRLKISTVSPNSSEAEPNDDSLSAGRLQDNEPVRGTIGRSDDVDFFVISGLAGETMQVNINAFGIGSFLDARVILRDPVGTLLVDANDSVFSPDPFIFISSLPLDGDYSIEVRRRAGTSGFGASQFYELTATTEPSPQTVIGNPDLDGSGRIDGFDLALLSRSFGISAGDPLFDPNIDVFPDSSIDGQDLSVLGEFFGGAIPPVMGPGQIRILADTEGDGIPIFGPALKPPDLVGLATGEIAEDINVTAFFSAPVESGTGGVMSIDVDASGLTGNLATADAFIGRRNLGSELEVFFDAGSFRIFEVADSRSDILPAFEAVVGDIALPFFPKSVEKREPLFPTLLSSGATTVSGRAITFALPAAKVGNLAPAQSGVLALSMADVEPTDRLPNTGRVNLGTPFQPSSITVSQMICQNNGQVLCDPATSDADCGPGVACVDADGASSSLPTQKVVYLRTPAHVQDLLLPFLAPPLPLLLFRDIERGTSKPSIIVDFSPKGSNDTLESIFPPGRRLKANDPVPLKVFRRDQLNNFSPKVCSFDPHTRSTLPPPDVDFFYFTGGEGDHATIDLKTDDQGLTFDSMIELFALPISLSVTDPSSAVAVQPVSASQLEFLSSSDDKSAADLDPRLDFILPRTGIYVVKVTASPKATLPGVEVFYSIELHSLRPDEVSVPVIIRGGYIGIITGLKFQIQFDSTKVKVTGVDDIQGLRLSNAPTSGKPSIPSAQEIVVQPVPGSPGHVDVAIRSFDGNGPIKPPEFCPVLDPMCSDNMGTRNGVSGFSLTRELLLARIRFRAVGPGTTRVVFVPNPTTQGATLLNVAEKQPGNRVFIPANGFGPGVTITVTP